MRWIQRQVESVYMSKKTITAPVQKNDQVLVSITDISEEGEGIGKADGFTLFIKDTLPGDEVLAKVTAVKKGYGFARMMKLRKASGQRTEPRCPAAAPCGGCQIQAMDYAAQLKFKTDKVKAHMSRLGHLPDVPVLDTIGMKTESGQGPWHYRNKAQYPVREGKDGQICIGFYAGRTHSIIETPVCHIGQPVNEEIIEIIRNWMITYRIPTYNETTGQGYLRHIMIRSGCHTGEIMVCLVVNSKKQRSAAAVDDLIRMLCRIRGMTSICLNINTSRTNVILGSTMVSLYGPDYITDRIGPISYRISAQSFFQVNPLQTEVLYGKALEFAELTGQETVWDLYCGTGTISLFLARQAKQVYGVEIVPAAIENARINAANNQISNAEFYVGKAEEVLPERYQKDGIHADVIVTDPPRKGCEEIVLETMVKMNPDRIVYVSCNSSTLARDLQYLDAHGYQTVKVQPVDMFPHTTGVECVAKLVRK